MDIPNFQDMEWSEITSYLHEMLTTTLFQLQETQVTLLSIMIFLFFLVLTIVIAGFIRRTLQKRFLKRFDIDDGLRYTLSRVSYYVIVTIGLLISFQFVGVDLSSLAVIFGLLSVGIGFGLQNITNNFISGLIVLFERPISVGDRVDVGGIEGDVLEINIRSTKILTLNNISIIVPNQEFVGSSVINYSHGDPTYRLDLEVGVSYSSDLDTVLKALNEVAEEHPDVMKTPKPMIHLKGFGDSSWDMALMVWVPDVKRYRIIRNEMNQAIVRKFREYGVEIPFPQRDLHIRSGLEKGDAGKGPAGKKES
ncbi:MAG: mechanosensitive ion channel domain-containing protein [Balneolaceae bacterium]